MRNKKPAVKKRPVVHDMLVALRLPTGLRKALEKLAAADRRTFSNYVRILLEDHVQRQTRRK